MNEIKRQLDLKLGNTTERSARLIQKIEAEKKLKRVKKQSKWNGPVYIGVASLVTALALFFLIGPFSLEGQNPANNPIDQPSINGNIDDEDDNKEPTEPTTKETLRKYFKESGTVAYFQGFGNEYATFKETTKWISPDFVEVLIDNGGIISQKIYRITDDAIELIINQAVDGELVTPYVEELLKLDAIMIMMVGPLEDHLSFAGQTMKLNVPFKTPYGEFNTVLIESGVKDTTISTYYAEGFGLVGEVYTFSDGSKVESYLASLNENPTPDSDLKVNVYNESTKSDDVYSINDLPFVDPYLFKSNPDYYNMTYRELVGTTSKDIGVLSYNCNDKEQCSYVFVAKDSESISIITHAWGSYGNVQLSPDNEVVGIPINSLEQDGNSTIERSQIVLIDLSAMKQIIPDTDREYFESATYPIESFTLNNTSIKMRVADVVSINHQDIAAWQNQKPLKMKELTVTFK